MAGCEGLLIAALVSASTAGVVDENTPASAPATHAVPGGGGRWFDEATRAYDALRFDDARVALDRALRDPDNPRARLVQIYRLLGVVEASMGQPVAAKRAFAQMLVLDTGAQLPDEVSPKIRTAYDAARASLPGERGVLLESAAGDELRMGQAAAIPIRVNDTLGLVEQLVVRYRVGDAAPHEVLLGRAEQGVLHLPASALPVRDAPYTLVLEAEAQNPYGARLATLEAGAAGTRIAVVRKLSTEDKPLTGRWWFWAGLAGGVALVAAAAGGLTWALVPRDSGPRDIEVGVE